MSNLLIFMFVILFASLALKYLFILQSEFLSLPSYLILVLF